MKGQGEITIILLIAIFAVIMGGGFVGFFNHEPSPTFTFGLHSAFIASTPNDVDIAAQAGMSFIINYGQTSQDALNPSTDLGKAFIKHNIKSLLDVHYLIGHEMNYKKGDCYWGDTNTQALKNLVLQYHNNPILGGYWTKDDDLGCDMKPALLQMYKIIRSIDRNPRHIVMPGFGVTSSMSNYADGVGDILAFYPYPAYNEGLTVEQHVINMLEAVKKATPPGKTQPPFIGVYQAFAATGPSPCDASRQPIPILSQQEMIDSVKVFMEYGAIGVSAFSVGPPCDVNEVADNTKQIQQEIIGVNQWLQENKGKIPKKRLQ